ncbi:MAG: outer membrane beta-barrel protein [Xanthomonadaceae bacterium]|nr:outer membrane beta-barrel protein [Xanthomonadaceae bacterium]
MSTPKRLRVLIILCACALPAAALAAQPGWYVAIDGGLARYGGIAGDAEQWVSITPSASPPPGMVVTNFQSSLRQHDLNHAGYRMAFGYQFNPYFGIEGSYATLGSIHASGDGRVDMSAANGFLPLEAVATFANTAKLQTWGWELAATGSWPLGTHWSLLGRVGVFDSHTSLDIASAPAPPPPGGLIATFVNELRSRWEPTFGVGVGFSPVDHWAVRLDWDRYLSLGNRDTIMGRFNVNLLSLGVVYTL